MFKLIQFKQEKATKLPYSMIFTIIIGLVSITEIQLAFVSEFWSPVLPSVVALYISTMAMVAYAVCKLAKMRKIFGRYLTDEVVATLLDTHEGLKLGGQKQIVTLLLCDLRGFSVLCEQVSPEKIAEIINIYLEVMAKIIHKYRGTINNFMGDGIFVTFGTPIPISETQERAISCAIAMQLAMNDINNKLIPLNIPLLKVGISIHTGAMFVGNVGSRLYSKYTVMGSNVNLVFSIDKYSLPGRILISSDTLKSSQELIRVDRTIEVIPKGTTEIIVIYEISGIGGKYNLYLPQNSHALN